MGWAAPYIERLRQGETVTFRPRGHSMSPRIKSGQACTVAPVSADRPLQVDDVVLCRVRGQEYLHRIVAIRGTQYQIGNQRGHINGWCGATAVCGVLISIAD